MKAFLEKRGLPLALAIGFWTENRRLALFKVIVIANTFSTAILLLNTCAPQILDPGRTDPVTGPSPSCGMIVA